MCKDESGDDFFYEGWLRQITLAVVGGDLDGHLFMCREPGSGIWEYVELKDLSERIEFSPSLFGYYVGDFSFCVRTSDFKQWLSSKANDESGKNESLDVSDAKPSHYLIIAALLEYVKGESGSDQEVIINSLESLNKGVRGVTRGNMEKLFARSNKEMKAARKNL